MWLGIEWDLDYIESIDKPSVLLIQTDNPLQYIEIIWHTNYTSHYMGTSEIMFLCEGNIRYYFWEVK